MKRKYRFNILPESILNSRKTRSKLYKLLKGLNFKFLRRRIIESPLNP